jgi:tRNA(adenine34) deaminase
MFDDIYWMQQALELADYAATQGEVPIGAIVVLNNEIIGKGWNQSISTNDPTAHAEIVALRNAAKTLNNYRLPHTELYVTLEPCSMCAGALVHARVKRLVFAALEPKAGVAFSQQEFFEQGFLNHRVLVEGGVLAELSKEKLQHFFHLRREKNRH